MSVSVSLHPVITDNLIQKIGFQVTDYKFEYENNDYESKDLFTESVNGQEHIQSNLFLKDSMGVWNCTDYNLKFQKEVFINNVTHLFSVNGVAGINAEIGLAVIWKSKQSSQQGVFIGESFTSHASPGFFSIHGEFNKGILREKFELTTIIYLKNAGKLNQGEEHLAQLKGTFLGELETTIIHLKGHASFFPIFSYKEDGPLWRIEYNWEDPRIDLFDEDNVRIILNENHIDYKNIVSTNNSKLNSLMKEITASSIQMIIQEVIKEVSLSDVISGVDIHRGSVCMAVQYFIQTFDLDASSSDKLAYTLRRFLDKKVGIDI